MLRSILSIIIGWLIYGLSVGILISMTGIDPHGESSVFFKIGSTIYGIVFAFIGGFVTALIAKQRLLLHSISLSLLLILIAIAVIYFTEWNHWSEWVTIFLIAPFAAFGGWVRLKTKK
jgi:hypothetical protein